MKRVAFGLTVTALLCAGPGLFSPANAQTIGSSYSSVAPGDCRLARKAADDFARDFKCGKDEVKVIGETGRAVSLAKH
jgi:hypothetical protein